VTLQLQMLEKQLLYQIIIKRTVTYISEPEVIEDQMDAEDPEYYDIFDLEIKSYKGMVEKTVDGINEIFES